MRHVTLKVSRRDAEGAAKMDRSALVRVAEALGRALRALDGRMARKTERKVALALPGGTKLSPRDGGWSTKQLRAAVFERSEGRCENDDCGTRITPATMDLDHYLGRARAPQLPENCWALCMSCHRRKHAGDPSRVYWLEVFLQHLGGHGFAASATARKVGAKLDAEKLLAEAEALRAGAVSTAEDLAERARRAEGADRG